MVKGFRRNDIIQYVIYMLILEKTYSHLGWAKVVEHRLLGFSI